MTMDGYNFDKKRRAKGSSARCKPLKSKTRQFTIIFRSFLWLVCEFLYELSLAWTLNDGDYCCFCSDINRILMQSKCMGFKAKTQKPLYTSHTKYMITSNKTASACEMLNKGEKSEDHNAAFVANVALFISTIVSSSVYLSSICTTFLDVVWRLALSVVCVFVF